MSTGVWLLAALQPANITTGYRQAKSLYVSRIIRTKKKDSFAALPYNSGFFTKIIFG